jgi:lysophospholipase L1-like esterase
MRPPRTLLLALAAVLPTPAIAATTLVTGDGPGECSGTAPVVCHFDVLPGNYDVTVLYGGTNVTVRAEARRMMLGEISTEPDRLTRQTFSVNVREPEGEPTKIGVGTPGLTLTFDGTGPQVRQVSVHRTRPFSQVLFLAGDSTVCDQDTPPYTGWGQAIPQYLRQGVTVANYADSGESTASFLADPLLFDTMKPLLRPRDVVLIQFGHNDKQTTAEDYRANLTSMIEQVRAAKARPVLISPPVRRLFDSAGALTPTALHVNGLGVDLPVEMATVAAAQNVPYINLTADSAALVSSLGTEDSKALYLYNEAKDNTHFSEYGADQFGRLVLARLEPLGLLPHAFRD